MNNEPLAEGEAVARTATAIGIRDTSLGNVFERMDEYVAVLEEHGRLSARRQNLNDVFVGINTIFLTGLGFLLVQSRFGSWSLVAAVGSVSLAVTPINIIWRAAIERYRGEIKVHVDYLTSIEKEFRSRREMRDGTLAESEVSVGFYHYNTVRRRPHAGKSRLEKRLATYFVILYPIITLVVTAVTFLIVYGWIPAVHF